MTSAAYRLAAGSGALGHAARGKAAMAHYFRGYQAPRQSFLARVQALRRLVAGLGLAAVPRTVRRVVSSGGKQGGNSANFFGLLHRHGTSVTEQHKVLAGLALGNHQARNDRLIGQFAASGHLPAPAARFAIMAVGAEKIGAKRTLTAGLRVPSLVPPLGGQSSSSGIMRRSAGAALSVAGPRLNGAITPVLSSGAADRVKTSRGAASVSAPSGAPRLRSQVAAPMPQRAVTPGFLRTVRQPGNQPATGHVYLDKALVGYHLAAAITAEQTRAAARPNTSATRFNGSMAVLRPSGAGI